MCNINVGTIGHIDHGTTSIAASILRAGGYMIYGENDFKLTFESFVVDDELLKKEIAISIEKFKSSEK